jgi:hypothetical protein
MIGDMSNSHNVQSSLILIKSLSFIKLVIQKVSTDPLTALNDEQDFIINMLISTDIF